MQATRSRKAAIRAHLGMLRGPSVLTVAGWLSAFREHGVSTERRAEGTRPPMCKARPGSLRPSRGVPKDVRSCVKLWRGLSISSGCCAVSWEMPGLETA